MSKRDPKLHAKQVEWFAKKGIRLSDDGRRHWCNGCEKSSPMNWYDDGGVWYCDGCGHTVFC